MYIILFHKCLDYIRVIILSIQLGSLFVWMICFCLKCFLPAFSRGCHCFVWDVWLSNMTFAYTRRRKQTPQSALHCVIVNSEWQWWWVSSSSLPRGWKGKGQRCVTSGICVTTATCIELHRDLQEADFRQRRRDRWPAHTLLPRETDGSCKKGEAEMVRMWH